MTKDFLATNSYFIDEKVNFLKFENCYLIYDNSGNSIGSINQKVPLSQKILRLLLNKKMLPFRLEIRDSNKHLLSSINRGWTFFMSTIIIRDSNNVVIGSIKQKFKFFKPTFQIFDTSNKLVAIITGDWKAWSFIIKDASDNQIGTINKKWAGAMKEIFTTADKYNVNIEAGFTNDIAKLAILSSAITIDMILKE